MTAAAVSLALAASGCGGEERAELRALCAYSFDATVREGPTEGRSLRGMLLLGLYKDGGERAVFVRSQDGRMQAVPTGVERSGDRLRLEFRTRTGTVVGNGPEPAALDRCEPSVKGPLTGPTDSDRGDWVGEPLSAPAPAPSPVAPAAVSPPPGSDGGSGPAQTPGPVLDISQSPAFSPDQLAEPAPTGGADEGEQAARLDDAIQQMLRGAGESEAVSGQPDGEPQDEEQPASAEEGDDLPLLSERSSSQGQLADLDDWPDIPASVFQDAQPGPADAAPPASPAAEPTPIRALAGPLSEAIEREGGFAEDAAALDAAVDALLASEELRSLLAELADPRASDETLKDLDEVIREVLVELRVEGERLELSAGQIAGLAEQIGRAVMQGVGEEGSGTIFGVQISGAPQAARPAGPTVGEMAYDSVAGRLGATLDGDEDVFGDDAEALDSLVDSLFANGEFRGLLEALAKDLPGAGTFGDLDAVIREAVRELTVEGESLDLSTEETNRITEAVRRTILQGLGEEGSGTIFGVALPTAGQASRPVVGEILEAAQRAAVGEATAAVVGLALVSALSDQALADLAADDEAPGPLRDLARAELGARVGRVITLGTVSNLGAAVNLDVVALREEFLEPPPSSRPTSPGVQTSDLLPMVSSQVVEAYRQFALRLSPWTRSQLQGAGLVPKVKTPGKPTQPLRETPPVELPNGEEIL